MTDKQKSTADAPTLAELSFEQAQSELGEVVERMERGEQDLEQSLQDFERGVALMNHCHRLLKEAEQKVEILVSENDGVFNTEAFAPEDA